MHLDLVNGIDSLTNFKRDTTKVVKKLKDSGQPLVLTINGKAEVVVQDAGAYQKLLERVERAEMAGFLKQSKQDVDEGRTVPAREALKKLAKKHKLKTSDR